MTTKPNWIDRMSYCLQFEIGIDCVKLLKFNKNSKSSEQTIFHILECQELEF